MQPDIVWILNEAILTHLHIVLNATTRLGFHRRHQLFEVLFDHFDELSVM